jgi:hypothetical protein
VSFPRRSPDFCRPPHLFSVIFPRIRETNAFLPSLSPSSSSATRRTAPRPQDMRQKFADEGSNVQKETGEKVEKNQGAARAISSFIDPSLSWKVRLRLLVLEPCQS